MTTITKIEVRIKTGDREGAGTDGYVYACVGGREFNLDTTTDDFVRGQDRTYILGDGANIRFAKTNDPRNPQLNTEDLGRFPVYLRFEPKGDGPDWNLEEATIIVNPGPKQARYSALSGNLNLWLGQHHGKICYLK